MQGADDHLGKPFQAKELMARVSTHLQLGKMRRELEKRVLERTRDLVDSELRYRNLAQKYSEVMLLSPVGIFAWDMNGTITFTNPKWCAFLHNSFSSYSGLTHQYLLRQEIAGRQYQLAPFSTTSHLTCICSEPGNITFYEWLEQCVTYI